MSIKFVAEFTTNHMGNKNVLLRMVEKAAWAGCTYIKMQKKDVETFYKKEKLDAPYASPYGSTYRDYRSIFEFDAEDYAVFDQKCRECNIKWFTTVQDIPSLGQMLKYDHELYKVASTNSRNVEFLQEVSKSVPEDKGIVISVAGSTLDEIEATLNIFPKHKIYVLHCVAEYPCPPESLRLGNIKVLKEKFEDDRISIGYSGHEEGIVPTFAAIDLGAEMIERHFCLSRYTFVHHIECSLKPEEFQEIIGVVKTHKNLQEVYASLPESSFGSNFGMSEIEKSFLMESAYGQKFVGKGSRFHGK